ncbi:MAG TPA: serpin family protein [Pirellulales bacterium]|jgi:serpin B
MQGQAVETDNTTANNSGDQDRAPVADEHFARDLLAQLRGSDNLAISPTSIESCVLLALAGARGETAAQIATALHLPADANKDAGALLDRIQQLARGRGQKPSAAALVIANSAWIDKSLPVSPQFETLLKTHERATLRQVDFVRRTDDARKDINSWVDTATRGKIAQLLAPGVLDDSARLVLVNAIYFKGTWLLPFNKGNTKQQAFQVSETRKVDVPLMRMTDHMRYAETDDYQVVELAYANSDLAMVVWLPRCVDGLSDVDRHIAEQGIASSLERLGTTEVDLSLPRFRVEATLGLRDALASLGMKDAFTDDADFSGISSQPLSISAIVHRALVEVDEIGTEAAAATGVIAKTTALPGRIEKKVFRADHPFLFAIRQRMTGDVLFLGRLVNPAP